MQLSIIIPAYNEKDNIKKIHDAIGLNLKGLKYEMIFINDGSVDGTENILDEIYLKDKKHVKVINFSRNFGKDAAIYAGLEYSSSEYSAIIDSDMQQDPKYLLDMFNFLEKNSDYDQVAMTMKKRKNISLIKKIGGSIFYKIINIMSKTKFKQDASDFRMIRKNVRDSILSLNEKNRFSKGIFSWVGFKTKYMEYDVKARYSGKTKFNLKKSIDYAMEGITDYSDKPLKIASSIGFIIGIPSFIYLLYIIIFTYNNINKLGLLISIILIIGSIQLICIGIIGKYIYKSFIEVKNRPIYIIKNKSGL